MAAQIGPATPGAPSAEAAPLAGSDWANAANAAVAHAPYLKRLLERRTDLTGRPAKVDVSRFLNPKMALTNLEERFPQVEAGRGVCAPIGVTLNHRIFAAATDAIDTAQDASLVFRIRNGDRSVGATVAGRVASQHHVRAA